jgi:hypothetical protein
MNKKRIIILVLAGIIIAVGFFLFRPPAKNIPVGQIAAPQQPPEINRRIELPALESLPTARAITVIKRPEKKVKPKAVITDSELEKTTETIKKSYQEQQAPIAGVMSGQSSGSSSGSARITRDDSGPKIKPTPQEQKEMNAKGIIIY